MEHEPKPNIVCDVQGLDIDPRVPKREGAIKGMSDVRLEHKSRLPAPNTPVADEQMELLRVRMFIDQEKIRRATGK